MWRNISISVSGAWPVGQRGGWRNQWRGGNSIMAVWLP